MATLNIFTAAEFTIGSQTYVVGSKTTPAQLTYASDLVAQRSVSLAPTTAAVLLTIGSGLDIPSADAIVITSDEEVGIQLEGASAANNSTFVLGADKYVILTDGQVYTYNADGNFGTTTLVDIETIRARNASASVTAIVRVWAFT